MRNQSNTRQKLTSSNDKGKGVDRTCATRHRLSEEQQRAVQVLKDPGLREHAWVDSCECLSKLKLIVDY